MHHAAADDETLGSSTRSLLAAWHVQTSGTRGASRERRPGMPSEIQQSTAASSAIRPFRVEVPEETIADLRRRIANTRFADRELVDDQSQGVQLATVQELARYWANDYDMGRLESRLNVLPQFKTEIDGLDIHFIHVRSEHEDALPLLVTHGWPGSIVELLNIVAPLTNPTAHGGSASDAFHLVLPSMPGYGFSGKPTTPGWNPPHIGRAWDTLMKRLGYERYVSQGGDWGAFISELMQRQAPAGLLAVHINFLFTRPPEVGRALALGAPAPAELSEKEKRAYGTEGARTSRLFGGAGDPPADDRPEPGGFARRPGRLVA
jgi:pimeloyl-ACP methyl ester carboxylesterase